MNEVLDPDFRSAQADYDRAVQLDDHEAALAAVRTMKRNTNNLWALRPLLREEARLMELVRPKGFARLAASFGMRRKAATEVKVHGL